MQKPSRFYSSVTCVVCVKGIAPGNYLWRHTQVACFYVGKARIWYIVRVCNYIIITLYIIIIIINYINAKLLQENKTFSGGNTKTYFFLLHSFFSPTYFSHHHMPSLFKFFFYIYGIIIHVSACYYQGMVIIRVPLQKGTVHSWTSKYSKHIHIAWQK